MQLDHLDRSILRVLQKQGRISNADLSDKVGLSPSACHRRVQRLEAEGIVRDYVALLDARKAIDMFNTLKTPVLGLVENMSVFTCPECGHRTHVFSTDGGRRTAEELGVPFLGALPLDPQIAIAGDERLTFEPQE